MAADLKTAIVRRQVESVEFGLYTDEDVRTRSICEITSPQAYDSLGTPLPRGLYDPIMGPTDQKSSCPTCGNVYLNCPGHAGHIELCVPVYHPLMLSRLLVLLRIKCLACHNIRLSKLQIQIYCAKLHLINIGQVKQAMELDDELACVLRRATAGNGHGENDVGTPWMGSQYRGRGRGGGGAGAGAATTALQAAAASSIENLLLSKLSSEKESLNNGVQLTSHERSIRRALLKEIQAECTKCKKCMSCGAFSPNIRHDSFNKIFQGVLSEANKRVNLAEGIKIRPASVVESRLLAGDDDDEVRYDSEDSEMEDDFDDDEGDAAAGENTYSDDEAAGIVRKKRGATTKARTDKKNPDKYMHPLEVEAQVRLTWRREPYLCSQLFGTAHDSSEGGGYGWSIFFLRAVPVPPPRFRPPIVMGHMTVEHAQNYYLSKILTCNERVRTLFAQINSNIESSDDNGGGSDHQQLSISDAINQGDNSEKKPMSKAERDKTQAMAISAWIDLQTNLNCFMDSSKDPSSAAAYGNTPNGIRQLLEKKEGIFRKHMMGKRVNYACRSVISPDPYVGTNEIGIPLHFAKILTFPTPVTALNVTEMRRLIKRGPDAYPGASWVEFPDGRRVFLDKMNQHKREAVAARLLAVKSGGATVTVGRQLRNGDMMLVNRQPTLHKPGIMAHYVRILHNPTQKTIRMHYANCNTYNADFDGDEMNCHFPQSYLGRAECEVIAGTDMQFIVPTDGSPLRGLIQDHVDSGVKMTAKDTFLEKWEYQQLLFAGLASLPGLEVIRSDMDIELVPPAIRKPRELWTGKQVITTLLNHLRKRGDGNHGEDLPGVSVEIKAKTPASAFGGSMQEHLVLIRDGELLRGVLDKAAFGSAEFSLVHGVYEAYGPKKAGLLLNALGRLFTAYLQYYSGHSCRMEDLVLTADADAERRKVIERAYNMGARAAKAWADAEGGKVQIKPVKDEPGSDKPLKPFETASAAARIGQLLSGKEGPTNFAALDGYMQSQLSPLASEIIKKCLPDGLAVPFPANTFSLMVTTGAKGSKVNQSQVSCALGQQALEGRRVPRMSSGRTLPSFAPYDPSPRADGFIADRFLTGIRPQEYYFHCMAGREGLVDTAVKTSRSGYLQRCLVKHLEELKVCYDSTVRDGEGGVIQFLYGEDGLDPTKAAHLDCTSSSFQYIARNHESLKKRYPELPNSSINVAAADSEQAKAVEEGSPEVFKKGSIVLARKLRFGSRWVRGALCRGWFDAVITERYLNGQCFDLMYLNDRSLASRVPLEVDLGRCGTRFTDAMSSICTLIKASSPDPILLDTSRDNGRHRVGSSGTCVSERVAGSTLRAMRENKDLQKAMGSTGMTSKDFGRLVAAKYSSALCAPGEAVGCIAAQSIGEPSTQMTLNTFHLAGSGANVTLGIPRLREIIMTASRQLKTPTMSVPLHPCVTDKQATRLTRYFTKLTLMELIASHDGVTVSESLQRGEEGDWERAYHVTLKLHPAERIKTAFGLTLEDVAGVVTKDFIPKLAVVMKRELQRAATESDVGAVSVHGGYSSEFIGTGKGGDVQEEKSKSRGRKNARDDDTEEGDDDDDEGDAAGEEDGVNASRFVHRKEMDSYGDMDDDEKAIARDAENDDQTSADGDAAVVTDDEGVSEDEDDFMISGNTVKIDRKNNRLMLHPLRVDPSARPLLMVGLVERAAAGLLVRSRPQIDEAFINEEEGRGRCLQTAGVNFSELWNLNMVDHHRIASNDIWAIRCTYGVEAARMNIVEQIRNVFAVYGISVDPRHLSLIADYMTFDGGFKAMNRIGMGDISSPFLQMSFETTAIFMTEAALNNKQEHLNSPSASIVLGRPIRHGTGAFELFTK